MRGEMAKRYLQLIKRCQDVECVLTHGIVRKVGFRLRTIALAAASPIDADHAEVTREEWRGEIDPLLAGEIAVDKHDRDVAFAPCSPAELNFSRAHPWHRRRVPYSTC